MYKFIITHLLNVNRFKIINFFNMTSCFYKFDVCKFRYMMIPQIDKIDKPIK